MEAARHRHRMTNEEHDPRPEALPEPLQHKRIDLLDDNLFSSSVRNRPLAGINHGRPVEAWNALESEGGVPIVGKLGSDLAVRSL